jgi:hypothetical protein
MKRISSLVMKVFFVLFAITLLVLAPAVSQAANYPVGKGDSLWKIAKALNVPFAQLVKQNPDLVNPNRIYPGQMIKYDEIVVGAGTTSKTAITVIAPDSPAKAPDKTASVAIAAKPVLPAIKPELKKADDRPAASMSNEKANNMPSVPAITPEIKMENRSVIPIVPEGFKESDQPTIPENINIQADKEIRAGIVIMATSVFLILLLFVWSFFSDMIRAYKKDETLVEYLRQHRTVRKVLRFGLFFDGKKKKSKMLIMANKRQQKVMQEIVIQSFLDQGKEEALVEYVNHGFYGEEENLLRPS